VMVIRLLNLPEHLPVPIGFQRDAALVVLLGQKALARGPAVVEQGALVGQIPVLPRRIGHLPGMRHIALNIDEVHHATASRRREQRETGRSALRGRSRASQCRGAGQCSGRYSWRPLV